MSPARYRHFGCRITDEVTFKGMRTVFLENDVLRVGVLLDKGADIFQFLHKPTDTDFLWHSPNGIIRPDRYTPTAATPASSFLDLYHGGWQEILPGGGPAQYNGAELGLHGEVNLLGWEMDILQDTPECITVRLSVDCLRMPLHLERVLRLEQGQPTLFIEETLSNRSPAPVEFMWGHHPAFGAPFLREGVRLFIPARRGQVHAPLFLPNGIFQPGMKFDWPLAISATHGDVDLSVVPSPQAGYGDLLYLSELQAGWYALLDPHSKIGFGLAWEKEVFPYLWFWLVYGKAPGYPWWDQVYCLALEPWTSMPNHLPAAIEAGTQITLEGGGCLKTQLCAAAITGKSAVDHIDPDGTII